MDADVSKDEMLQRFTGFCRLVPFNHALKLEVVDVGDQWVEFKVPYQQEHIGEIETGILHGGVISTLMDNTCAGAVFLALNFAQIATLDLRTDYHKPSKPGMDVFAYAECYKTTKQIAFTRGVAFNKSKEDPIATTTATYIMSGDDIFKPFQRALREKP